MVVVVAMTVALSASTPLKRSVASAEAAPATHTVAYDHYSVTVDGERVNLWSAEFHYWRLPSPDLWRDVLEKYKAAARDIEKLLNITTDVGIYVIAGPGPTSTQRPTPAGSPAGS